MAENESRISSFWVNNGGNELHCLVASVSKGCFYNPTKHYDLIPYSMFQNTFKGALKDKYDDKVIRQILYSFVFKNLYFRKHNQIWSIYIRSLINWIISGHSENPLESADCLQQAQLLIMLFFSSAASELYSFYHSPKPYTVLEDGLQALEALQERNICVGAISNFDNRLHDIIPGKNNKFKYSNW